MLHKLNNKLPFALYSTSLIFSLLFLSACGNSKKPVEPITTEIDDGSVKAINCDCSIFTFGEFTWEGECTNGFADGEGTINWLRTGEKYTGTVMEGYITGKGTKYISNCKIYEGDWVDGKYSGKGTLYLNKNVIYTGDFINGVKSGQGVSYAENGKKTYIGKFEDGLPNGYGEKYDSTETCVRRGHFQDGIFEDEKEVQDLTPIIARNVVKKVFNGGTDIEQKLYAVKFNEDESEKEFILDIKFNGNILESREYECRVLCRNFYPEIEFLYKNDNVEMYLVRNKIRDAILGEKDNYGLFEVSSE